MFTGIVKAKGRIAALERRGGDVRLQVEADGIDWGDVQEGDSICINGVCLTATTVSQRGFRADVSNETLRVTTLGDIAEGAEVNLEPALTAGDRLGGHIVSGHVDCTGQVVSLASDARSTVLGIELPAEFSKYVAKKGSICIDGVSLTINEVSGNRFELNIIPHTAEQTTIGNYAVGTRVNIEVDVVARYLERLLGENAGGLSIDFLRANGYA